MLAARSPAIRTPAEARLAVFNFVGAWYNPRRWHSRVEYLSGMAHEKRELYR